MLKSRIFLSSAVLILGILLVGVANADTISSAAEPQAKVQIQNQDSITEHQKNWNDSPMQRCDGSRKQLHQNHQSKGEGHGNMHRRGCRGTVAQ